MPPPPPTPVDPSLDNDTSFSRDNNFLCGLEHVLPPVPGLFHPLEERPAYLLEDRPAYPYPISGNVGLTMQRVVLPCRRQDDLDISPIGRFEEEAGPWNPQGLVGHDKQPYSASAYHGFPPQTNRLAMSSQIQPRSCDRSEVGSSTTGRNPLDSGYDSKSYATKSIRSRSEYLDRSQDCQSLVGDVGDLQMHPEGEPQGEDPESLQNEPHPYGTNDGSSSHAPLVCPHLDCTKRKFKNQSDLK